MCGAVTISIRPKYFTTEFRVDFSGLFEEVFMGISGCRFPALRVALFGAAKLLLASGVIFFLAVVMGADVGQIWG